MFGLFGVSALLPLPDAGCCLPPLAELGVVAIAAEACEPLLLDLFAASPFSFSFCNCCCCCCFPFGALPVGVDSFGVPLF